MRLPLLPSKMRLEKTVTEITEFDEFGEVISVDTRQETKVMIYDDQRGWITNRSEGVKNERKEV